MTNNFLLKISKFFLYLVPFTVLIVYQGTLFPFIVGKYAFFRTAVWLALIFFVWAFAIGETRNYADKYAERRGSQKSQLPITTYQLLITNPLVIAVAVFVFIFLLAGFLGANPSASFWSNFERGEGGLQLLALFTFFVLLVLLFRDEKSWERMFKVSVIAAVFFILYGVLAALGIKDFIGDSLCVRFSGSLGNSAYVGTYMIFSLFYGSYLLSKEKRNLKKFSWFGLMLVFAVFLFLSQTRGAFLGLGAAIISGLVYLVFVLPRGRMRLFILLSIFVLLSAGVAAVKYNKSINLMPFCSGGGGNQILDVRVSAVSFQTRLTLWQKSIEAFKERPILGWGPENFNLAFEKHYDTSLEAWYDRAHNIFFDYLVFSGALGLLSFIGIFGVYYWQFFRKARIYADRNADQRGKYQKETGLPITNYQLLITNGLLFALPIAYLVQGLVLFDVLPIYINLFLFLGFAVYKFSKSQSAI